MSKGRWSAASCSSATATCRAYTDGLIQAMNASGDQFGMDELCVQIERSCLLSVEAAIRDQIFRRGDRLSIRQADDITLLVMRYRAPGAVT